MAQSRYLDLNRQIDVFESNVEELKKNPESKYDNHVLKQKCVNETLASQVNDAKEKLAQLTQSLKSIQVCGKGINFLGKNCFIKNVLKLFLIISMCLKFCKYSSCLLFCRL